MNKINFLLLKKEKKKVKINCVVMNNELLNGSRSSKAPEVAKPVYGTTVPVLSDEKLSMRVLVSVNKILIVLLN